MRRHMRDQGSRSPAKGLVLMNLGSPDEPTAPSVRRYLRQFLSDPRVIDVHPIARAILVYGFILPFRPAKSAAAYRKIWQKDGGSPLIAHSRALADAVQKRLGDDWHVELAMRYGRPSIASAAAQLAAAGVDDIVLFPLYPQYAASSTGSSLEEVFRVVKDAWVVPNLSTV